MRCLEVEDSSPRKVEKPSWTVEDIVKNLNFSSRYSNAQADNTPLRENEKVEDVTKILVRAKDLRPWLWIKMSENVRWLSENEWSTDKPSF